MTDTAPITTPPDRPATGSALPPVLALAASAALAVAAAWPIYATPALGLVATAAGVFTLFVGWISRHVPGLVTVAIGLLLWLVLAVVVAVPAALTRPPESLFTGVQQAASALFRGWKQLLTIDLPVGTYQATLVPFFVTLTVSLLLAWWLRRSAWAAVPLTLPVLFGTVFGRSGVSDPIPLFPGITQIPGLSPLFGPSESPGTVSGLVLPAPAEVLRWVLAAMLALAWIAHTVRQQRKLRHGSASRRIPVSRIVAALSVIAIAVATALVLLPVVDRDDRAVLRDHVDPQLLINSQASPLGSYRASKTDEAIDEPWFTVTSGIDEGAGDDADARQAAEAAALPERLSLVTLDTYNGVVFTPAPDARFKRFPLGSGDAGAVPVTVRIGGYRGIWMPVSAPLASVPEFTGPRAAALADAFYVNPVTGSAIAVPDAHGMRPGDGYRVKMQPGRPVNDPSRLGGPQQVGAENASDTGFAPTTETMPELLRWITTHRAVPSQAAPETATDLFTLLGNLRASGYLSHALTDDGAWIERAGVTFTPAPGGHSVARLESLFADLNTNPGSVAAVGDDEQFAAAGALIARALGYDSRVVLGVRLDTDVPGIPACASICTGEHLAAWIEVRGDRGEWVAFDVSPQTAQPPSTRREGELLPEFPTVPDVRAAQPVDPPESATDQNIPDPPDEERSTTPAWWPIVRTLGLWLLVLLSLVLPLLFLPVAKLLRSRSRRRRSDPLARALGAWEERRDLAVDAGVDLPPPGRATTPGSELSDSGGSRIAQAVQIGTPNALALAEAVDQAVFHPDGITLMEADELWELVDADRAADQPGFVTRGRRAYRLRSLGKGNATWK